MYSGLIISLVWLLNNMFDPSLVDLFVANADEVASILHQYKDSISISSGKINTLE